MSLESIYLDHAHALAEGSVSAINDAQPLEKARTAAQAGKLPYAGKITPVVAWKVIQEGQAILVDVRTAEERKFVGHVPDSFHVPWATGTSLTRNPRFVKELESRVGGKSAVVLLLCRSGNRSALAAEAAHAAGFTNVFNISEGFEGDLDQNGQRGSLGGWRHAELPWVQD
jgi:rhodanese-related sulfurtransferase